jgi:hypothetical protein
MRAFLQNWKRAFVIGVVLAVGACLIVPQALADEGKAKEEQKDGSGGKAGARKVAPSAKLTVRGVGGASGGQTREQALKKAEEERNADPAWKCSHTKVAVIRMTDSGGATSLNNYCLNNDGSILACCGGRRVVSSISRQTGEFASRTVGQQGEIRVLSPKGKLLATWPMEFMPEAVCVTDRGVIFVAGAGRVVQLDQQGKAVRSAASPQMSELPPLPPIPKEEDQGVKESRLKKVEGLKAKLKEAQEALAAARKEATPKGVKQRDLTDEQRQAIQEKLREPQAKLAEARTALREAAMSPQQSALQQRAAILGKASIKGIAVSDKDVFVSCSATKGRSFAVWRMDRELANPKRILDGLRGCCGQMDIQSRDGDVWVAHNAKHRVERYDRDGKQLLSFGRTDHKKADGFGGCCEPKNLRFGADGTLYTCESGPPVAVKHFTTEGKFLGVVAVPLFESGCVRVTIEVSRDGSTVYVLSPSENAIYVMSNKPAT